MTGKFDYPPADKPFWSVQVYGNGVSLCLMFSDVEAVPPGVEKIRSMCRLGPEAYKDWKFRLDMNDGPAGHRGLWGGLQIHFAFLNVPEDWKPDDGRTTDALPGRYARDAVGHRPDDGRR